MKMTIIICPTEKCNFRCTGCFEPQSQRSGLDIPFNMEGIKRSIEEIWAGPYGGSDLCLHGGECTLIPRRDFEELLRFLHRFKGVVSIVTNGSTIDDHMIELFKRYNVYPGISCDGPPELNIHRGPDPTNPEATRKYNVDLQRTIVQLREAGLNVSIMCILHRDNASTPEKLRKLEEWMRWLKSIGIIGGRMNPMFTTKEQRHLELTPYEVTEVWRMVYEFNKREGTRWNPLQEMIGNLKGEKLSPCIFVQCDIFNTKTISVLSDGTIGNCDRTFQNDIYLRSKAQSKSGRYEALQQTQCKGCRFWVICGGACPMEGFDDDWRNKTRFCESILNTYTMIERELRQKDPNVVLSIDGVPPQQMLSSAHGDSAHGDSGHGDAGHTDIGHGDAHHGNLPHGDETHGDSTHGDMNHGDSAHGDSSHYDTPDYV